MSKLVRNLFFFVKNSPNNKKAIANRIHRRTIVNLASVRLFEKLPAQTPCKTNYPFVVQTARFSSDAVTISQLDYERFCAETLDSLCDYFEELVESVNHLASADILNKDGVLTVSLGATYGTYVINKQSPNKQIWLSSPASGPKRYDFMYAADGSKKGYWVYKHTGETLHELLDKELTDVTKTKTQFQSLSFGSRC
ncbi:frataxin homolog, mitochondrial [Contarinia nasturtii]|uniref:frataxin homolog, mitochondrial n=1 Tax=Contarinia nasturtii TaxID=265458 RepID=UPI0012D48965|nr:frataxin homolog, mitochondrial [Contarinia nasturtii]